MLRLEFQDFAFCHKPLHANLFSKHSLLAKLTNSFFRNFKNFCGSGDGDWFIEHGYHV